MQKYLYLTEFKWIEPWINGGNIPVFLANKYKSQERSGIFTPDEGVERELQNIEYDLFKQLRIVNLEGVGKLRIDNLDIPNMGLNRKNINYEQIQENGYVLSFCNTFDKNIGKRLGKKACIEIYDVIELFNIISGQLGIIGESKNCEYTTHINRNSFLKSKEDAWQDEYRLYWKIDSKTNFEKKKEVCIPPNTAKFISNIE